MSGDGKHFKDSKNLSARQHLARMRKSPKKYKTTKEHIEKVDGTMEKKTKELERNIKGGETRQNSRELKIGLHIRANGRLGVITGISELIKVKFPTGYESEYPTNKITFCRDPKKAKKQFDEDVARRQK